MDNELRQRLDKLSRAEQEERLDELAGKLKIAHPRILDGDDSHLLDVPAYEEYIALKRILGCID